MRRILLTIAILALGWGIGLMLFVSALPATGGPLPDKADGIVVFTGVGGARVATAMTLMDKGTADRLLISGVNPDISRSELAKLWPGEADSFDCCVDLGIEARTTEGNAAEVRDWTREHNFSTLILVTSDYHMPRALLETRSQLPDTMIFAHAVQSGYIGESGRPATLEAFRQLAFEYTKFLAVCVKTFVSRFF